MSQGIVWIAVDSLLKILDRFSQILGRPPSREEAAFQVKVVGLAVVRITPLQLLLLRSRQLDPERPGNFTRNFLLETLKFGTRARIPGTPDISPAANLDQFDGDGQFAALRHDAAGDNAIYAEGESSRDSIARPLRRLTQDRASGHYTQVLHLCERVSKTLSQTFRKMFRVGARVRGCQWHDGDGSNGRVLQQGSSTQQCQRAEKR